ncbi:hypothetical protein N5P37_011410 [Trichoderma harzianum]|uniref:Uncharacterized protein n=1 Tax=Trichoderma harzianum CBS 226.95 TaxID=983964 RepID=A0A2T3ZU53_TRIHA|nr:hypothetical protein M431DRAFT_525484 [Trichoderma harzianum CBS 226.95]KAK0756037.1 hypothetical protein N5P37_011410 [Trichoderma harzianum]PKK48670.1 hypothetical protein CI102_7036 [Trichoderma harzianum]PTB48328.1 hypothetical protein M431DRAFT_525484 [Trichoderma harzianum CBS 226.95]
MSIEKRDLGSGPPTPEGNIQSDVEAGQTIVLSADRVHKLQARWAILRYLNAFESWLDRRLGVETQGVDRIPEEEKRPPSVWNIFLMWWSLNIHVGVLPLGLLGPEFGLSLKQSIAASIIGIILGALMTATTGTLGPKLGMRQIATSRYSFGFWGAKLCSVLNIVVGGGFAVVNYVVVGQILSAVSGYTMSITVGIVIIAIISYVVSIFGFRLIHTFEKYSWIYTFILICVLIGQAAPHVKTDFPGEDGNSGLVYSGTFLTIVAINFSNASGWCSIAADYYCNFPASTPAWKTFFLTFWGIVIPTTFSVTIGCCLGNAAVTVAYPPYADAYTNHGLGGLISEIYHPQAWSRFCLVLLTFSVLGNNIAINYSSGLSMQLLGHYFHAVPRFIWSLAFAIVVAVLAIAGQQNLSNVVNNFVSLLGYWTVSFTMVLLLEDRVFRRKDGYDLEAWDQPHLLPWGVAAVAALLAGYLAGGVPGMSQTWYVGPIAAKFGGDGGDVGIYMSAVITVLVYTIGRFFEKKYTGR